MNELKIYLEGLQISYTAWPCFNALTLFSFSPSPLSEPTRTRWTLTLAATV